MIGVACNTGLSTDKASDYRNLCAKSRYDSILVVRDAPDGNRVRISSKLYTWKGTVAQEKTQHKMQEFGGILGCHF